MMWHWNSLWAPAPGDPPAIDDPALWRAPWSPEQAIALQARTWETMVSATHSWWSMMLAAWPAASTWPVPAWNAGVAANDSDVKAATAGAEPLARVESAEPKAAKPAAAPRKRAPARKR
jgi:hypothetical protein